MSVFVTGVSSSARMAETTIDSEYGDDDCGVAASRRKSSNSICLPYAGANRIRFRGFDHRPVGHPEACASLAEWWRAEGGGRERGARRAEGGGRRADGGGRRAEGRGRERGGWILARVGGRGRPPLHYFSARVTTAPGATLSMAALGSVAGLVSGSPSLSSLASRRKRSGNGCPSIESAWLMSTVMGNDVTGMRLTAAGGPPAGLRAMTNRTPLGGAVDSRLRVTRTDFPVGCSLTGG